MNNQLTKEGVIITGYKATDENMCCLGFQYELNKWYEYDGDIELCESGFHFCEYPSGVWSYYVTGRLFKIEAELVLKSKYSSGTDIKHVAKRIRLVEEIVINGDRNTGDRNTGDRNTGNRNTGDRNTGDDNTGNDNTGYRNTGDGNTGNDNTGYRNTGYRNTGYRNTGDRNTGDRNTGDRNTGDGNTGDRNTGDRNTGDGNCCDYSSGYFNIKEQPIIIFDEEYKGKREELNHLLITKLSYELSKDEEFDVTPYLELPNATEDKIKELHRKHIEKRKQLLK